MSYHVMYSARQGSWYIETDGWSDDFGTSLYDTEQDAYDAIARLEAERRVASVEAASALARRLIGEQE